MFRSSRVSGRRIAFCYAVCTASPPSIQNSEQCSRPATSDAFPRQIASLQDSASASVQRKKPLPWPHLLRSNSSMHWAVIHSTTSRPSPRSSTSPASCLPKPDRGAQSLPTPCSPLSNALYHRIRPFPHRRLQIIPGATGGSLNVYIISVILGIVEGLTEFLPVSSTAHLRIAEALLNINLDDAYWKMYTIVIQAGAILALLLLYLGRILDFMRTFPRGERRDRNYLTHPISLTILAFICTSIPALLLKKWSDRNL